MQPRLNIRKATGDDATVLTELINFAGEGLPVYLWEQMAEPGEDAWQVGRRRALRKEGGFSYRNAIIAELDDRAVACLIGYSLPPEPVEIDYSEMPAMFVPMQELENLAPNSWYVNVLATYPEFRGRGIGTGLLDVAEKQARDAGNTGLSIIVSDANPGAQKLYSRCGYLQSATRPMVKNGWHNDGVNWVLMVKNI
jgi:ribosomal protein S18 acetylase RimI-like enzyme